MEKKKEWIDNEIKNRTMSDIFEQLEWIYTMNDTEYPRIAKNNTRTIDICTCYCWFISSLYSLSYSSLGRFSFSAIDYYV